MIKGFWKTPVLSDTRIFRLYKEYQNLDVPTTEDLRQTVERLVLAGAIETLEAQDGNNPTLASRDLPLPVWNDFPHINSEVDRLDYNEYVEYFESTNAGNPFEIEYMEPYEPEGSIKYFSAGETLDLAIQAANSYQSLIDEQQAYYGATGPMTTMLDIIETGITAAANKINTFDGNYVTTEQYKSQWDVIVWDIFHIFNNTRDRQIGSSNYDHKLKRGGIFGGTRRTASQVFRAVSKYQNSRREFNKAIAELDKQEDFGKPIGARGGTSVLTLLNNGVSAGYGNGSAPGDLNYNPSSTSDFQTDSTFLFSLSRGMYNIYSEFDRYINTVNIGGVGEVVSQLQNLRQSLILKRAQYYTFENGEYIVDLGKALFEEEYIAELEDINNIIASIEAINTNIPITNIANTAANVQSLFLSMKRACYLKAYRMIDCGRRRIAKNTNYYLRLSNRTVSILQSAIPELSNTAGYFRNESTNLPFLRSDIEALYNTELDFIAKTFITDAGMPFLDNPVPNLNNYSSGFFPNPTQSGS